MIEALRKDADTHAHTVLADAEHVRAHAHSSADEVLRAARAEAAQAIAAAEEQTAWTQETMQALLATAEGEAERLRAEGRAEGALHLAASRRRLQKVVHRVTDRLREDRAAAERDAQELSGVATGLVATAEADAARTQASAATKKSWPMPRATPKVIAPSATAICSAPPSFGTARSWSWRSVSKWRTPPSPSCRPTARC